MPKGYRVTTVKTGGGKGLFLRPFFLYIYFYMRMKYKDDPNLIENEIAKLSDTERKAFDFGYVVALCGFLEHIQDSKNRILSKLVISKDSNSAQVELLSRVYILDIYEKHYEKRLKKLERDLQPSIKHL